MGFIDVGTNIGVYSLPVAKLNRQVIVKNSQYRLLQIAFVVLIWNFILLYITD